tara:strand:- start:3143 stop:3541 length:399 start_codon:yes stop_codon:yes gene_type:complete
MSGLPFATGSASTSELANNVVVKVKFPYVTRWIYVRNNGSGDLRLGFSENGVNANNANTYNVTGSNRNYIVIPAAAAGKFSHLGPLEVKCTSVYLRRDASTSTGFELMAGYTAIPENQFLVLTGSNDFQGVG